MLHIAQEERGIKMRNKDDVMNELKSIPVYNQFFTKKEIAYLPEILGPDEHVLAVISGYLDGNTWIITLTPKRLICLDKGMIYGLKQREIPLDKINSVYQKRGLLLGSVTIQDGATSIKIDNIDKNCLPPFFDSLTHASEEYKKGMFQSSNDVDFGSANQTSGADEIMKYKNLLDQGIITQEEFDAKKKQILGL